MKNSLLLTLLPGLFTFHVQAQHSGNDLDPVEPLIVELRLGNDQLSDALFSLPHHGNYLLPLGELCAAIGFPIDVSPDSGTATGWFLNEQNSFNFDSQSETVTIDDQRYQLSEHDFLIEPDDIYVSLTALNQWFPLNLDLNTARLEITMDPSEKLPLQTRLERQRLRDRLGRATYQHSDYPLYPIEANWVSLPMADISIGYFIDDSRQSTASYSALVIGDLAKMTAKLAYSGSSAGDNVTPRLTLQHLDGDAPQWAPQNILLGDIALPGQALISNGGQGKGFTLSSYPLWRQGEFDQNDLRGDLPPGWDVELYRDDQLIASQTVSDDGRYELLDIPLRFGQNRLKLVFYGPQGQRREQNITRYIGNDQLTPGDWYYRLSYNQPDAFIFGRDPEQESLMAWQAAAETEIGLSQRFSTGFGLFSRHDTDDNQLQTARLALMASLFGASHTLGWYQNQGLNDGRVLTYNSRTLFNRLSANYSYSVYDEFISGFNHSPGNLHSQSKLRLDYPLSWRHLNLPFNTSFITEQYIDGSSALDIAVGNAVRYKALSFRNTFDWRQHKARDNHLDGVLLASLSLWDSSLRGTISYSITPQTDIKYLKFSYSLKDLWGYRMRWSLDHYPDSEVIDTGLKLSRDFGYLSTSFSTAVNSAGEFSAGFGATLNFSLGYEQLSERPAIFDSGAASSGSVATRVYLDHNGNRTFDDGDEPLAGVSFNGFNKFTTNTEGYTVVSGFSSAIPRNLTMNLASLPDPFLVPYNQGYNVQGRAGRLSVIDFPVAPTGELDGFVYLERSDGSFREVGNVLLQLLNESGQVVRETKSEYDGFFLLDMLPPGQYRLIASPEQLNRLELTSSTSLPFEITGLDSIIEGTEIILRSAVAEPEPVVSQFTADSGQLPDQQSLLSVITGELEKVPQQVLAIAIPVQEKRRPVILQVKSDDSLWRVSSRFRQSPLTQLQVMAAIFHTNPDAFLNKNMFYLRRDKQLLIPTITEMQAFGADSARSLYLDHKQAWENRSSG